MTTERAWVLLPSGRRLDLLSPAPDAWTDRDLAIGLSRTYRWGGHSKWELPLSVAQHSLTVLVMRQQMNGGRNLTPAEALRELLHDGDEGLLGFDPISPLKPHLGAGFKAVSDRLRAAIDTRYRLQAWSGEDETLHKRADHLAAASEAFHVTGWSREAIHDSLLIALDPLQDDPLPTVEGMQPWQPWPPRIAAALFLAKLHELMRADADGEHAGSLAGVVAREATLRRLADSFSRLPAERRHGSRAAPTGSSMSDTYIRAEAGEWSQSVEGVVVDGERDADGAWDFRADFTIFTTDEEWLVCHGYNCHVDVL
jgi:5'-deoxynucleotidase YfbR-like HD superfamily hydrolase